MWKSRKSNGADAGRKDDLKSAAGGMGLSNMRERVESLGGSIHVNCEKVLKYLYQFERKRRQYESPDNR